MTETTPSGPRPLYEFSGRFEVHLTLEEAGPERAAEAALWAEEHGLKFTHIELDRGSTPSQPMVTYHTGESTLSAELETADRWAERLAASGFGVTRTKLEVKRESPGAPAPTRRPGNCPRGATSSGGVRTHPTTYLCGCKDMITQTQHRSDAYFNYHCEVSCTTGP